MMERHRFIQLFRQYSNMISKGREDHFIGKAGDNSLMINSENCSPQFELGLILARNTYSSFSSFSYTDFVPKLVKLRSSSRFLEVHLESRYPIFKEILHKFFKVSIGEIDSDTIVATIWISNRNVSFTKLYNIYNILYPLILGIKKLDITPLEIGIEEQLIVDKCLDCNTPLGKSIVDNENPKVYFCSKCQSRYDWDKVFWDLETRYSIGKFLFDKKLRERRWKIALKLEQEQEFTEWRSSSIRSDWETVELRNIPHSTTSNFVLFQGSSRTPRVHMDTDRTDRTEG